MCVCVCVCVCAYHYDTYSFLEQINHLFSKQICRKNSFLSWRPEYFVQQTLNTQNTIPTTEYVCRYGVRFCSMKHSFNNALEGFSSFLYSVSDQ